jgi:hypothetical protein
MSLTRNDWLWVVWTQVWQVTVLIVAVAVLVRLVATNRPQLAFVLWLIVFYPCRRFPAFMQLRSIKDDWSES